MNKDKKLLSDYQNNPFYVATDGLSLLFQSARSVAVLLLIISIIGAYSPNPAPAQTNDIQAFLNGFNVPPEMVLLLGLFLILFIIFSILVSGVSDYTAAKIAKGKSTSIKEAVSAVFARFWDYLWLRLLVAVKVLLWSMLLIVPGIVMAFRYSLAGVAFFEKDLRGNGAIGYSSQLVKGAWLTTFSSNMLLNLITLGLIGPLLAPGTNAVLYEQLSRVRDKKPRAHILTWVTLFIGILIEVATIVALIVVLPYLILGLASEAQR